MYVVRVCLHIVASNILSIPITPSCLYEGLSLMLFVFAHVYLCQRRLYYMRNMVGVL